MMLDLTSSACTSSTATSTVLQSTTVTDTKNLFEAIADSDEASAVAESSVIPGRLNLLSVVGDKADRLGQETLRLRGGFEAVKNGIEGEKLNDHQRKDSTDSVVVMNAESLDGRLLFAIPKKGRLHDKCLSLLAGADIQFRRHHRLDVCVALNHNIALVFLPASDIPSFVGKGNVDLGITGHDVILESQMEQHVTEVLRLGFGKCSLQVQVPEHGDIKTVDDLAGKRVVTSFEVLAGEYFKSVDALCGVVEESAKTKIEYVGGSVEAACALGLADGIVDLVESGDTMRAAGLHAIATVVETEAVLIKSSTPKHPHLTPLIELITRRIQGVIAASKYVVLQYNVERDRLAEVKGITPGRRAPTVSRLEEEGWVAVSVMVEKSKSAKVMDQLTAVGAQDIMVFNLDNCRV